MPSRSGAAVGTIRVVLCLTLLSAARVAAQDLPLDDLGLLDRLSRDVARASGSELPLDHLPGAFGGLRFDVTGNTVDKEKAFRQRWLDAVRASCVAAIETATAVAGEELKAKDRAKGHPQRVRPLVAALKKKARKEPPALHCLQVIEALVPRLQEAWAEGVDVAALFAAREEQTQRLLKRYDFGAKIAKAYATGTAVVEVQLPPETYALVKRELDTWHYAPLMAGGAQVTVGSMKVEYGDRLTQGNVREGLQMLTPVEYFTLRYACMENQRETEFVRITGAKLLIGTFYFVQHGERLLVLREPEPLPAPAGR
jgi:hypothetical protein